MLAGRQTQPFAIRAENIVVLTETASASASGDSAAGVVVAVQYHGAVSRWQVKLDAGEVWSALVTEEDSRALNGLAVGERVKLSWPREAAVTLQS
jgi:putative spermidine/putrescine transport system ATP-binding protein